VRGLGDGVKNPPKQRKSSTARHKKTARICAGAGKQTNQKSCDGTVGGSEVQKSERRMERGKANVEGGERKECKFFRKGESKGAGGGNLGTETWGELWEKFIVDYTKGLAGATEGFPWNSDCPGRRAESKKD